MRRLTWRAIAGQSESMASEPAVVLCRPLLAIEQDNTINLSTEPHTHDFHQFLYLRLGRCGVRIADRRYEVVEGCVASMLPGQAHTLEFPPHAETPCRVVQIKVWLNPTAGFPEPPALADCRQVRPQVDGCVGLLLDAFAARDQIEQDRTIGGLMMYLLALVGSASSGRIQGRDPRIRDAIDFIAANLCETITVAHLARRAGLDQSYFSRLFRAQLGLSPQAYVCAQRLDRARGLLVFTDAPIAEIAESVGYRNYHHFSNQFLATYGRRPSDYRSGMQDPDSYRLAEG